MKNPTILKDELGLLKENRSAVLNELKIRGDELKALYAKISETENELVDLRNTIVEETARLDEIRERAVFVNKELTNYTQDLRNIRNTWESVRVKNSQEQKLHLGRIKELKTKEENLLDKIELLKKNYDNNMNVFGQQEQDKVIKLRSLDSQIKESENELKDLQSRITKETEQEKKLTKDRLKREDKLRVRENNVSAHEKAIAKREENLMTMVADVTIVYGRLKELYAKVDPKVDLDKLITKAI